MKTTVVPAQITTVEDKIAGNFTFIQIMLLIIPLIVGTIIYAITPPSMHLSALKLILVVFQFCLFSSLAIRFKGKILIDWLVIVLRYKMRPRVYIFTKNDLTNRDVPVIKAAEFKNRTVVKTADTNEKVVEKADVDIGNKSIFDDSKVSVSVKLSKKGGLDVSLKKI